MSTFDWETIRNDAIDRFRGELPRADTEAAIIEVFEQKPGVVTRGIEEVAKSLSEGKARSGWAVLRKRVEGATDPLRSVTVDGNERELAIRQAEGWLHNTGLHFDREDEVDDELFGDRGLLRQWRFEENLRARLMDIWRAERPRGERADREYGEWAEGRRRRRREAIDAARKAAAEAAALAKQNVEPSGRSPLVTP